jgi:hypothetical protein
MLSEQDNQILRQALAKFTHWSSSRLTLNPDNRGCRVALTWFKAMDAEYKELQPADALRAPLWLRDYFQWGPTAWPLTWQKAMSGETLDCGALAYLAYESFRMQGVRVYPAQLLMRYPQTMIHRWREQWAANGASTEWIVPPFVYHEAVMVERDGALDIWDATECVWLPSRFQNVTGGIVALRFLSDEDVPPQRWGRHMLNVNQWGHILQDALD